MDVSILGCGWMGQPVGAHLAEQGHRVHGSTTTPDKLDALREDGIEPFQIELAPQATSPQGDAALERFFDTDVLFLNVPPPVRDLPREEFPDYHRRQIASVVEHVRASSIDWIVFASSTGVYPNVAGPSVPTVTEDDLPPGRPDAMSGSRRVTGPVLARMEGMLAELEDVDATILRFAGLYGGDRHPGRYLAGRSGVGRPEAPVNLIHRDDCVGVVAAVLEQGARNDVFNACAGAHPTRRQLYTRAAEALGLEPPTFEAEGDATGKIVSNEKLRRVLGYTFQHPDPLDDLR
jgi:nucleoside-diphosphate-sugar epimerase